MARKKQAEKTAVPPATPTDPITWDEHVIQFLMQWRVELVGLGSLLLAMFLILTIPTAMRSDEESLAKLLRVIFGWGVYPLLFSGALAGTHFALYKVKKPYKVRPQQVIGLEILLIVTLPLTYHLTNGTRLDAFSGRNGGLIGWALAVFPVELFGPIIGGLCYLALFSWGMALLTGFTWADFLATLRRASTWLADWSAELAKPPEQPTIQMSVVQANPDIGPVINQNKRRDQLLPSYELLQRGQQVALSDEEVAQKKRTIEKTLADFGVPATVTEIRQGPAITQYGVSPGYIERTGPDGKPIKQKVRVNKIASLNRDLTMALEAERIRIEAPVPGRRIVGIEVPNDQVSMVRLRPIIQSDLFKQKRKPLSVVLGRNVAGAPVSIDLAKLPHAIVAGTTGSGKSVCMNALITCLVFNNTPDQLNLVMIDPKKVELIRFNGLPHLIGKVEVEADRAVGVLRWLTAEMDRRYELFAKIGARNLEGYNNKVASKQSKEKPLPYLAVFIDELADLMITYPGDVERTLCRLAQMARATGIHMVVATQRPSTDVITGLIKANFPARLSFSVASSIDSRVILDSTGAEQLLGKGDMLFLSPDAGTPERVQGVFMDDEEIEAIVAHWQNAMPHYEPAPPPWDSLIARHAYLEETDMLLDEAIKLVKKRETISTSFLQRRLRLGYPRASRLMEQLHEMGLVDDPAEGGKTRRTLIDESAPNPLDEL